MDKLAKHLAGFLADNSTRPVHTDELRYGIEIFLGALLQIIIVAIAAAALNILKETMTVLLTVFLYRRYTGGEHCEKYYRCTISALFTVLVLGVAATLITVEYWWLGMALVVLLSFYLIYKVVPVDNPVLSIDDPEQRQRMKVGALVVLFMLLTLSAVLVLRFHLNSVSSAILLGLLWQDLTLFRPGMLYIRMWDKLFSSLEILWERR